MGSGFKLVDKIICIPGNAGTSKIALNIDINILDFNKILKHYKCVILKAGADWCVPCKTIEPLFTSFFVSVLYW